LVKLLYSSLMREPSEHWGTGMPRPTKERKASVKMAVGNPKMKSM